MCNTSGNKMQCIVWNRDVTFFGRDQNSVQTIKEKWNQFCAAQFIVCWSKEREGDTFENKFDKALHFYSAEDSPASSFEDKFALKLCYWSTILKHYYKALHCTAAEERGSFEDNFSLKLCYKALL